MICIDITMAIIGLLSVCLLIVVSSTEPGIIPRGEDKIGEMLRNVPYAYK